MVKRLRVCQHLLTSSYDFKFGYSKSSESVDGDKNDPDVERKDYTPSLWMRSM